ncbi:hypothetical protein H5407_07275 [Mitsuaria sp. WAJ17]|uniref:hypothetical protein n=1 Tax=Mitsuaria sp. WAJ17 TaxID=2761452 RepID=UPI001602EF99|nr:hypothetical protein [Mitsuaria sp. WAJ17]MBB2485030.1 hypothetical protein [Mitsuaria sp. WAJ17]
MHTPQRFLRTGNRTLMVSFAIMVLSTLVAYPLADQVGLGLQVLAHLAIVIAAGFFKLGYVLRLAAQHEMSQTTPAMA